eukprot:gene22131-29193_t
MIDSRTKQLQEPSSTVILSSHREPSDDIALERARATFNVQELCYALNGGKEKFDRKNELAEVISKTSWGDKSRRYFHTREEEYVGGLKAALGIWEMMKSKEISLEEANWARELVNYPGGILLHIGMFIPSLLSQGTPEQQKKWLPPSYKLAVIGTYAQTELGHGTFVRGLETTATYDVATKFIVHSPTLSATKWWPGGLGKTCSHAVVMARLFINGKDYGPHGFIMSLPGVTLGDIGPKYGFNGVDNGFLSFDHVRIHIIAQSGGVLGMAATIATRYCAVRRQTAALAGQQETQVLDYQNVSNTLLPLVAAAYALRFLGKNMEEQYEQFEADRDNGDFSSLPELHASSSGLKALSTWITTEGIEACRATCGGHGYSQLSGLPTLLQDYAPNITWEGDNNVLCLQVGGTHVFMSVEHTARFVLKALMASQKGATPPGRTCAYLANAQQKLHSRCPVKSSASWNDPHTQLAAMHHVARRLAVTTAAALTNNGTTKPEFEGPVWSSHAVNLIRLAKAHCAALVHLNTMNTIAKMEATRSVDASSLAVLRQLASLWALTHLEKVLGDLLEDGYVNGDQAAMLRSFQRGLLSELRPNAVGLVDALGYHDYTLNSALGQADGDVYRALLKMAQGSPLNDTEEGPGWHSVMKPVMLAARSKM